MALHSEGGPPVQGQAWPGGEPAERRAQDLAAVLLIVTGGLGLLVSLYFVHPLATFIAVSVGAISVGVILGLD